MCLVLVAHQTTTQRPLLVLANRDEFYERPTAAAGYWQDSPGMIAGRDLVSGGTWFGARNDRWAAVTNVREGLRDQGQQSSKSRGWLVRDYLQGDLSPADFLEGVEDSTEFAGFNLLLGDARELWYLSNRVDNGRRLPPGLYGLSNHLLDTPWPKVERGKAGLRNIFENSCFDPSATFALLANSSLAADADLPDTGVPLEWERSLSAMFVSMATYGTRCSTILTAEAGGQYHLLERRFTDGPESWQESEFSWCLPESLLDR